ncbi:MAG: hypothetical protein M3P27_11730 [Acidobacteriota bacterium]|nr:hypothetical protein [Acidobacteriota bacterium]
MNQAPAPIATTRVPATRESVTNASVAKRSAKGKERSKQPVQVERIPPPRPLTPQQLPPTRPTVSYRNGQLSILANNSTMADVLNSVREQTGAQFDMTGVSSTDRVYAKLGPGAPKDVLAALFEGSRFNFAILGSATDPAAVARVVLMPRAGGATTASQSYPVVTTQPGGRLPAQAQPEEQGDEEMPPEEAPAEEVQQPEPVRPEQQQQQQNPGQVKTPEQLLQELQQMQQQQQLQQQQQQQQNPNAQPPPQPQIPDREIPDDQPPQ